MRSTHSRNLTEVCDISQSQSKEEGKLITPLIKLKMFRMKDPFEKTRRKKI